MDKIRVLVIGFTRGVGGVESYLTNICKNLNDDIEVELLMHEMINSKYELELNKKNIKIHYVPGIKKNIFSFLFSLFKFYKKNKYDIVYLNECGAGMFIYAFPVLFNFKTKLIVHSHNGDSTRKILHKIIKPIQNVRADEKWACSNIAAKWMFGRAKNVKIIHNGVDFEEFKYNSSISKKYKEEFNLSDNFIIGSVARFNVQKNHKKIIEIFFETKKIISNAKLILIGDGELKSEIINMVKELELENDVLFLGIRNDINNFLSMFDIFLLPSLYEGLPFVAIESQASSLPIIASDTVTNEIDMTDLVFYEKLNSSSIEWAKKINNIKNIDINRNSTLYQECLRKCGFDVKFETQRISKEFERIVKKC